jgi:hypothetical protein
VLCEEKTVTAKKKDTQRVSFFFYAVRPTVKRKENRTQGDAVAGEKRAKNARNTLLFCYSCAIMVAMKEMEE